MRPLLYFILLSIKIKFTGVSVVGESWLVESKASKRLVDPWPHILKVKTCYKSYFLWIERGTKAALTLFL